MKNKMLVFVILSTLTISSPIFGGYFLDEKGKLEGYIQENGNGYILLDKDGKVEEFIQENGENGYLFLDSEGQLEGFYQQD